MIIINARISLDESELHFSFTTSPGPGGQNVNKVATAVQLRWNIPQSHSIPQEVRARLITLVGTKLTNTGDYIIKASRLRTQERNKQDALARLIDLIKRAAIVPKKRKKTKPTRGSIEERLKKKKLQGQKKVGRRSKQDFQKY